MTLTAISMLIIIVAHDAVDVATRAKKSITQSVFGHNLTEVGEVHMDKYMSSFILAIGIQNTEIDIMNNPFFKF